MYCPKCGKENADGASFCQSCGSSFAAPAQPVAPSPPAYQAAPYQAAPQGSVQSIPSHLGWAIVSILLFWPTGIPAVVYASRVDNLAMLGNIAAAQEASGKAKTFATISTVLFVIWVVIVIIATAVTAAAGI
jgi:hypothetical protein